LSAGAPLLPQRLESDRVSLTSAERYGEFVHLVYALSPTPSS
jgi:hypothetical protein